MHGCRIVLQCMKKPKQKLHNFWRSITIYHFRTQ